MKTFILCSLCMILSAQILSFYDEIDDNEITGFTLELGSEEYNIYFSLLQEYCNTQAFDFNYCLSSVLIRDVFINISHSYPFIAMKDIIALHEISDIMDDSLILEQVDDYLLYSW